MLIINQNFQIPDRVSLKPAKMTPRKVVIKHNSAQKSKTLKITKFKCKKQVTPLASTINLSSSTIESQPTLALLESPKFKL